MTRVQTAMLLLVNPLSDDVTGFRNGFGAEVSVNLFKSAPELSNDTARLC